MNIVLAIDDDVNILKILDAQISAMRYRVHTASSGKEGVNISRSLNPDVILLDISMPDMSGFEVIDELRKDEITRAIPVIMLTANKSREAVVEAMGRGIVDYIIKPHDPEKLESKIRSTIQYSRMRREETLAEDSESIYVSYDQKFVLITLRSRLKEKKFLDDAKRVFTVVFMRRVQNRMCVIDLRGISEFDPGDVEILGVIMKLFENRNVCVVTGRHYGEIVSNIDFPDNVKLFVSFGDMQLFMSHGGTA